VTFRWTYSGASGPDETFADQPAAEDWLRETWSDLLDRGVDAVTLLDGDRAVYGPMSLHPPED
jgi:hypothetical protein